MHWPHWMLALPLRVRTVFLRRRAERDLDDELAFHLEMQARANQRAGLSDAEAHQRARRQFGGVEQAREACRDARPLGWLDDLVRDVHYALRTFRRAPGFVAVAVLVLGLGIGANTTIFSLLNGLLFRPLAVPSSDELRFLHTKWTRRTTSPLQSVPYRTFRYLADHNDVFAGLAQVQHDSAKIGFGLQPQRVEGERVSTNYFDVLQVRPALGRAFLPSDDLPGASPVLIVSDRFWRRILNGNAKVVGATVDLREQPGHYSGYHRAYTVVGVMPPDFNGISDWGGPAEYWAPIRQRTTDHHDASVADFREGDAWLVEHDMVAPVVGRLKPGVTDTQVTRAVSAADRYLRQEDNNDPPMRREGRTLLYDKATASSHYLPFIGSGTTVPERLAMALMLVSMLVLLIAATNLAGILMARGVFRRGEIAARLALGAGRTRVARQVLTESVLLSLAGSVLAVGVARLLVGLFVTYMPFQLGMWNRGSLAGTLDVPIDVRALIFTAALGVAAGVLVGLVPALQALKTKVMPVLAGGAAPGTTARSRLRRWIVVPQIGLSLVLLLVAGVLVRTMIRAEFVDRGIEPEKVLHAVFAVKRPPYEWTAPEKRQMELDRRKLVCARILEKLRATPSVTQAAFTDVYWLGLSPRSIVARSGHNHWVGGAAVTPGYFDAMGIPIVRGRSFDSRDTVTGAPVAIVCERVAELLWPGKEAVGQYVAEYDPKTSRTGPNWRLVVGVAKEIRRPGLEDQPNFSCYTPLDQATHWASDLVVRGRVAGQEVKQAVMSAIAAADVEVEITGTSTLVEDIDRTLYPRRLAAAILALSGMLGLLLSAVGLYGIVSYSAAQRVREIGIRAALGAGRRDIVRLMLRDAFVALGIGIVLGVAVGFAGMRVVSTVLVGLPSLDLLTLVAVPALLCAVILAACLAPARRAARVNPTEVLRAL